jgi:hypothetical protein
MIPNPKEKAEQLVEKFMLYNTKKDAVNCALIAVNEIIMYDLWPRKIIQPVDEYWLAVDFELKKIK